MATLSFALRRKARLAEREMGLATRLLHQPSPLPKCTEPKIFTNAAEMDAMGPHRRNPSQSIPIPKSYGSLVGFTTVALLMSTVLGERSKMTACIVGPEVEVFRP